ncbi:uncharacterized protein ACOB8E_024807 [Sarcophilus harrisii]
MAKEANSEGLYTWGGGGEGAGVSRGVADCGPGPHHTPGPAGIPRSAPHRSLASAPLQAASSCKGRSRAARTDRPPASPTNVWLARAPRASFCRGVSSRRFGRRTQKPSPAGSRSRPSLRSGSRQPRPRGKWEELWLRNQKTQIRNRRYQGHRGILASLRSDPFSTKMPKRSFQRTSLTRCGSCETD